MLDEDVFVFVFDVVDDFDDDADVLVLIDEEFFDDFSQFFNVLRSHDPICTAHTSIAVVIRIFVSICVVFFIVPRRHFP